MVNGMCTTPNKTTTYHFYISVLMQILKIRYVNRELVNFYSYFICSL